MVTPFGKQLRKIRIDRSEILKDMADRLEVSPAFLSAVENGKRNVPHNWISVLSLAYNLSGEEMASLQTLAEESSTFVKMNLSEATDNKRQAALVFAREFETMSDETVSQFLKLIQRNKNQDQQGGDT